MSFRVDAPHGGCLLALLPGGTGNAGGCELNYTHKDLGCSSSRARDDVSFNRVCCKQTARLRRRYDEEDLPSPEAASAIAMAAPIEPKPSPAASEKLTNSAVDLLKMAEARTAALQTKVADRFVVWTADLLVLHNSCLAAGLCASQPED